MPDPLLPTTVSPLLSWTRLLASENSEVLIFTNCLSKLINNDCSGRPNIVGSTGGVVFPNDAKNTLNEGITLFGSIGHEMIDSVPGVFGYAAGGILNFGGATGNTLAFVATFSSEEINLIQESRGDTVVASSGSDIFKNGDNGTFFFVDIFITVTSNLDMTRGTFDDGLTQFHASLIATAARAAGGVILTLSDNTEIAFDI